MSEIWRVQLAHIVYGNVITFIAALRMSSRRCVTDRVKHFQLAACISLLARVRPRDRLCLEYMLLMCWWVVFLIRLAT